MLTYLELRSMAIGISRKADEIADMCFNGSADLNAVLREREGVSKNLKIFFAEIDLHIKEISELSSAIMQIYEMNSCLVSIYASAHNNNDVSLAEMGHQGCRTEDFFGKE